MDNIVKSVIAALVYIIAAPFVGALLAGVDRKITARMQGRRGPSVLQPFWDVEKLSGSSNYLFKFSYISWLF